MIPQTMMRRQAITNAAGFPDALVTFVAIWSKNKEKFFLFRFLAFMFFVSFKGEKLRPVLYKLKKYHCAAVESKLKVCLFTLIFAAQNLEGAYHFFEGNLFILVRTDAIDPPV